MGKITFTNTEYHKMKEQQEQHKYDPDYLDTIAMTDLYDNIYPSREPLIADLLYPGTYILAGSPNSGKSFLCMQLCYNLSQGRPMWTFCDVNKCDVLYLSLEDTHQRLQGRLSRMFGVECSDKLHFAIAAKGIDKGLKEQLEGFIKEHPKTKLIIIDTLQKVRTNINSNYSYGDDYDCINELKDLADDKGICLILVHHTRKQHDDDGFNMISGTNGLMGAADGAFLFLKEKRTSNKAILEITGRDQPDQRLHLIRNEDTLCWDLEQRDTKLWQAPPDPLLESIAATIAARGTWSGTATELVAFLKSDLSPNSLTRKLNISASRLMEEYSIKYDNNRTSIERKITLSLIN